MQASCYQFTRAWLPAKGLRFSSAFIGHNLIHTLGHLVVSVHGPMITLVPTRLCFSDMIITSHHYALIFYDIRAVLGPDWCARPLCL